MPTKKKKEGPYKCPYKFIAVGGRGYIMGQSDTKAALIRQVKAEIIRHRYETSASIYTLSDNVAIGEIPIVVTEVTR